ncbi:hypothetical protein NKDENANG_02465 [Candidatus Entotheonellaceae bacterium PAL068K]
MLTLNLASVQATGARALRHDRAIDAGDSVYLALEDGKRRVKYCLEQLMATHEAWPPRLWLTYQAPRTDEGRVDCLSEWAEQTEAPALVFWCAAAESGIVTRSNY